MKNVINIVHNQCLFGKLLSHFYLKIVFMVVGNILFCRIMASLYLMNRKCAIFSINISANNDKVL